ncbi:Mpp10 protein [Ascodesmis nigricans]|uniref:U3 small nucleolar ribonucleoprotein protein MPP10 n=1 Tax=Ascodesmis nigricans TaxID=341454 RepID=A0A4S2N4H7_9PEZI|nr:Mpp10 protein [Ascodesmis nigricans]
MADSSSSSTMSAIGPTSRSSTPSTALFDTLQNSPHDFFSAGGSSTPGTNEALRSAALQLVKRFLDPILEDSDNNATKSKKRKIGDSAGVVLDKVYVDGFEPEQVWEQVKGVVGEVAGDGADGEGKKGVRFSDKLEEQEVGGSESESDSDSDNEMLDGSEGEGSELQSGDELEKEEDMDEVDEDEMMIDAEDGEEVEFEDSEEDMEDEEENKEDEEEDEAKELVQDKFGLNDGFFSIDDFNRQTELLELQDARGAALEDDDEDDIDYHADPSQWGNEDDEDDSDDDADLKQAMEQGKDDFEGLDDDDDAADLDRDHENANDIMYADFFAPPARKKSGNSKPRKPRQSGFDTERARRLQDPEEAFETMQSEMERVRRDLFAEDSEEEDESDVDMDGNAPAARNNADPLSRRSKYEKQRSALMDQIRELESANIAKRQWTLAGEASAKSRPLNSLLEEDLDFERAGKPVPVITQEVTEGLEDMIKRRILKAEFDEVIKRRPDEISAQIRRGRVEIDDSKPSASLAEIYEKDVLTKQAAENAPEGAQPAEKDEKEQETEKEILAMWADLSRSLDALTNWHYTPKPAAPSLSIVADAPAISMEEAQPSAAAGGADANISMLAPQEIYKPGHDKAILPAGENNGGREIVGKSGIPISTKEMTSEERKRRRQREKSKIKKQNAMNGVSRGEVKEGSKKDVVDTLRKGGAKVIGKGGEMRTVDGKVVKEGSDRKKEGSHYKL